MHSFLSGRKLRIYIDFPVYAYIYIYGTRDYLRFVLHYISDVKFLHNVINFLRVISIEGKSNRFKKSNLSSSNAR